MSSKLRTVLICIAGAGFGAQAYAAGPQTGAINITGKVIDTSCTLNQPPESTTINVNLPPVSKDLLSAPQSSTGRGGFSMNVHDCPDGVKVSAAFITNSHVDAHGNLKNTAANPASNVQVQLLDKNYVPINITTDNAASQMARGVVISAGATQATLQYYVQYFTQVGGAANGDVAAMANYQLTYE